MKITRFFTVAGQSPYTGITFTARESQITGKSDEVIFSNKAVVVPDFWSNLATDILAQKYFRRKGVNHQHKNSLYNSKYSKKWFRFEGCIAFAETDLRQTIHRIVGCWTYWGERQKYFDSTKDAQAFYDELSYMLAKQMFAPNSPQWFNTGLHWAYGIEGKAQGHFYVDPKTGFLTESTDAYSHPQPSACFINAVEDDLVNPGGIFDLFLREARLFKQGSGAGSNMSALRGENEPLSGGGKSSGLMSWLRHGDTGAGSVKSGGTTRRAALMRILNVDHPDVEKFINWKVNEEHKVVALAIGSRKMKTFWEELVAVDPTSEKLSQAKDARIKTLVRNAKKDGIPGAFIQQCLLRYEQGDNNQTINTYDTSWEGEGYQSVSGMNSNNSVRVTDTFMKCVHTEMPWDLHNRTGGVSKRTTARDLMDQINRASFLCGDPGLQFDTTINDWHTCPEDGRINGSNPCCFVGETEVETSEGRIRFDSLEALSESGKRLPRAFSWDLNSNLPALKRIKKVWVAGETTSLVRVSTDKGLSFLCTPEHRFLLRSGEYVEARCLQPGTRLRKVGRFVNEQRSQRRYINHRTTAEHPNGTVNQAQWMWEQAYGRIPEGFEVHHISEDPTDDRLSNFELHESSEHQSLHSKGCANSRFIETDSHLMVEIWESLESKPRRTASGHWDVTPGRWNQFIRDNGLKGKVPMAQSPSLGGRIQGMFWSEFAQKIEADRALVNDQVSSVETLTLESPVKVYDLEVEDTHNFAISSGEQIHSIIVSNSEYMFLDDTACNLASINLVPFLKQNHTFDIDSFVHTCSLLTLALEISVLMGQFPSAKIAELSYNFRTLGLGYANLGSLLMRLGLPYDSDGGRTWGAAITSLMTGSAYLASSRMAAEFGVFPGYDCNEEHMLRVMRNHRSAARGDVTYERLNYRPAGLSTAYTTDPSLLDVITAARTSWDRVVVEGGSTGFRNAQVTVLAPTGTIGLVMDCDTTGVEPDFALVKYKKLAGGGYKQIINSAVPTVLANLGYAKREAEAIEAYILGEGAGSPEGAPLLKEEHLAIFDCANKCGKGTRYISPEGHVLMMAATQPFLSGAISKTVNLPADATIADVERIHNLAWQKGIKAIALYREGSKMSQAIATSMDLLDGVDVEVLEDPETPTATKVTVVAEAIARGLRTRLPSRCTGFRQKAMIGGHALYLHTGEYHDGNLGEIFIDVSREGAALRSWANCFAVAISLGLQYGVPLEEFVDAFTFTKFEPNGFVQGSDAIKSATSMIDYIFRELAVIYLGRYDLAHVQPTEEEEPETPVPAAPPKKSVSKRDEAKSKGFTGDSCTACGSMQMVRSGTCSTCQSCAVTTGCS